MLDLWYRVEEAQGRADTKIPLAPLENLYDLQKKRCLGINIYFISPHKFCSRTFWSMPWFKRLASLSPPEAQVRYRPIPCGICTGHSASETGSFRVLLGPCHDSGGYYNYKLSVYYDWGNKLPRRSQWPRGLRRGSAATRLLGLWVRIPPVAWMSVCYERCVLSGRGLCDGLIERPEESHRLCVCLIVCDLETYKMRQSRLELGCCATGKK
jgi:hypothetical protein